MYSPDQSVQAFHRYFLHFYVSLLQIREKKKMSAKTEKCDANPFDTKAILLFEFFILGKITPELDDPSFLM